METRVIPASSPEAIPLAVSLLRSGRLVAFPTDTVYGLGGLAFDSDAVGSIYKVKGRPEEKAIPILIADASDLTQVVLKIPVHADLLAAHFWPGPLTLVLPKHPSLPPSVSATATIGVRVPDHAHARALLKAVGPMAVSSANRSGQSSASTAQDVLSQLEGRIPLILDGGKTPGGVPSTVVELMDDHFQILREGPILKVEIMKVLKEGL